ncbi:hypothetical protein [Streptomyces sp. SID3343]|uniref:hypothetical protein n=1 Tax=Streptomyces sp. SID3343 TaxID=2690260 RepID=UPI00136FFA9A|nr:hypothetical protein [Streptomyces sp. SID3343]MYW02581.1 hypothetical protein [Streptomyces sp. SID3343]
MSFNGDIVVLRGETSLVDLAPDVGGETHPVYSEWRYAHGWCAVHVRHFAAPRGYDRAWLTALAAATGSPVLVCSVFESDVAHVQGLSGADYWEGWLDPGTAASRLAGDRLVRAHGRGDWARYRDQAAAWLEQDRPRVAQAAVRWAAAAGHTVPAGPIAELLGLRRDPFVEDLFFHLLTRLGLAALPPG